MENFLKMLFKIEKKRLDRSAKKLIIKAVHVTIKKPFRDIKLVRKIIQILFIVNVITAKKVINILFLSMMSLS